MHKAARPARKVDALNEGSDAFAKMRRLAMRFNGILRGRNVSAQFPARSRVSFDRRGCQAFVWDQAVAVLAKLNGSRSEMSASDARCGNSLRMWRK